MWELLKKFEEKQPEIVFEWKDPETEAEGWAVINSLRGGAAGGGTRMREGLDRGEVESLAKTMEIKFTISGPPIGGAKSGINFNPLDPRKIGVLERWYKAIIPLLKSYYGTGGDLNIDEVYEVIPLTEDYGLWHPQEGIVNGHFRASEPQKIQKIGQLRMGVSKVLEDIRFTPSVEKKYTVSDMITGFGVAESVKHYYSIWGGNLNEKTAIIQGWGNVGASAAYYLAKNGVKIIGIIDKSGGIINKEGLNDSQVKSLFLTKKGNTLSAEGILPFDEVNEKIWSLGASIFIPAAASRLVDMNQIESMVNAGLEVISCGANVPFKDTKTFYGPTTAYADENAALIPDFIANCGMARVFTFLMSGEIKITDESIFNDVSETIKCALKATHEQCPQSIGLARTSFENALKQLI